MREHSSSCETGWHLNSLEQLTASVVADFEFSLGLLQIHRSLVKKDRNNLEVLSNLYDFNSRQQFATF